MKKVIAVLLSVTLLFSVCGISFSASALAFPKVTDKINQDSNRCFTNAPDDGLIYADILYDIVPMTEDEKDDYVYEQCGIRSSDLTFDKSLTDEEKEIKKQKTILYYSELRKLEQEQANANAKPFLEQMGISIQYSGETPIYHNRQIIKSDTGMFICMTKAEILKAEKLDYVEGIICYRRVYNDNKTTILFENTRNWDKVYVYGWDNEGNENCGAYPGKEVTEKITDDDGDEYYVVDIPIDSEGILLNNGGNEISADIDRSVFMYQNYYAYRLTNTKNDMDKYYYEGYGKNNPEPSTEPTTEPVPVDRKSFTFTVPFGWDEAFVYAVDADGKELCGAFPGNQKADFVLNGYGETEFTVNIPEGAASVTLSNSKGARTAAISDFAYYANYDLTDKTDSSGNYIVNGTNPKPATFMLLDNYGWKQAYIYALDKDGKELNGAFPGVQAERFLDYGGFQFRIPVPDGAASIVVSNGKGEKTEKITDFSVYYGYSLSTKNADGDYKLNEYWGYLPDPASGDTDDPWYEPDTELHITDNFGWGTAYMYSWDSEGNEYSGAWPGTKVESFVNAYGEDTFICRIPKNAEGIIINDGKGHQSTDITDFTYSGYWFDGRTDDLGHYIPTGYADDPVEPTVEPTTESEPEPVEFNWFYNTQNFENVYIYAWDDDGNALAGEWPGIQLTHKEVSPKYECDRYRFPEFDGAVGFIINDGETKQTEYITDYESFRLDGAKNDEGHYLITPCNGYYDELPYPTEPATKQTEPSTAPVVYPIQKTVYITDNFGWGTAYMYSWDNDGNEYSGAWPGTIVKTTTNDYGENVFVCDIPANAEGFIINDGKGNQSSDITDFASNDGYWFDGTTDDLGHYIPTGYANDPVEPTVEPTTGSDSEPVEYNWFYNTLNFEKVYQYAWDAEGNELVGEWPGKLLTVKQYSNKFDCDKYRFDEIEGAVGCIIHDGNGKQTVDLYGENMYRSFKLNGGKDSSGSYLITYCSENGDYPQPFDYKTVFITDTLNWGTFYLYAWDDEGNPLTGEWPGSNPNSITDDLAQTVFICEIPRSAAGFIVSDGNGKQSIEITDFYYYEKYWFDGTMDGAGNFIPTGISFDPPEPPEVNSLRIIDTLGWGTGYLYAWDAQGNALTGEWPGTKTETLTNDYGENVFICEFPANAAGIIINDGNGNQSSEIIDLTYDCYWFDGKKDNWGHYIPRNYVDPEPSLPEKTLRITDNFGWETGYLYAWDADGNSLTGEWPGKVTPTTINDYGQNVFLCEIPYNAAGIIINDGKGNQSTEITDFYTYDGYWFDGTKDDEGHCVPTGYYDYPPVLPNKSVLNITDTLGWGTAYMYAWDDQGNELTGEWPGMMTESFTNDYGENVFVCNIPKKAIGIVINNGNGSQSAVIDDLSTYEGYYFDGTKDDEGHYIPTGYLDNPVEPTTGSDLEPVEYNWFYNTQNFENVYIYAWDDNGNALAGEWPGRPLTDKEYSPKYECDRYRFPEFDGAVGFIISDGETKQTEYVTGYESFMLYGKKNDEGHYLITKCSGHYVEPTDPTEPVTEQTEPSTDPVVYPENRTIEVVDSLGWGTGYIFAWDAEGNSLSGEWPGTKIENTTTNLFGENVFICNIPENAEGIVVNDGEFNASTDITDFSYDYYWFDGTMDDLGHYFVTGYNYSYDPEPVDPPHSSEMYRQKFLDWSVEKFGENSLQDGYEYEELYTHKDGSDPDWVLVKARFTKPEPEPETWLRIGGIDGRTVISGSLKDPFMFGYGIYDVKEDKFYGLEEFAEKVDPVFYNREGQPLDYSKYDGLIQALTDAKVGYKTGDTNGDGRVDILDTTAIQKHAVEKIRLTEIQKYLSDVNSDGAVDVLDAVEIQKFAVS